MKTEYLVNIVKKIEASKAVFYLFFIILTIASIFIYQKLEWIEINNIKFVKIVDSRLKSIDMILNQLKNCNVEKNDQSEKLELLKSEIYELSNIIKSNELNKPSIKKTDPVVIRTDNDNKLEKEKPQQKIIVSNEIVTKRKPIVHIVKQGDSIQGVSREYGVLPEQIIKNNNINANSKLSPGQKLIIK